MWWWCKYICGENIRKVHSAPLRSQLAHHLLEPARESLRKLRHHPLDLGLGALVARSGTSACQHLRRQDWEYNVSSLCVSLFGNLLLIFSPISSQGPTFMAQSSWNLMNASSLSLASVMMLDPVQATPPTAELTASTAPARMPLLVVVGRPGRLVGGLLRGGPLGPPGRLGGGLCSGL